MCVSMRVHVCVYVCDLFQVGLYVGQAGLELTILVSVTQVLGLQLY